MVENKEWKKIRLGDIITLNYGKSLPAKKRVKGNIPVYSSAGNTGNHNIALVEEKGIIVGRKGTVGSVYRVDVPFCCIDTAFFITQKDSRVNLDYLYYLLKWLPLDKLNSDSAIPGLNRENAYNQEFKISLVKKEQEKIADILKSLDDKIELNNKMNETLEEMAQTMFKEWFVNFNFPNEEGKSYKDNGGKMIESELGMIPEGWRVGSIDEIAEVVAGGTPSKKIDEYFSIEKEIPWITPKDLSGYNGKFIGRGAVDITKLGLQKSSAKLMPKGTVLFSSRAPIGYIAIAKNNITTNQGFKSLVPNKGLGTEYLYYMLHDIKEDIENHASGSTFKEVSGTEMKKHKLIIPLIRISDLFEKTISKWSNLILKNEVETDNLTKIRDTLLPKLMSGKVRV